MGKSNENHEDELRWLSKHLAPSDIIRKSDIQQFIEEIETQFQKIFYLFKSEIERLLDELEARNGNRPLYLTIESFHEKIDEEVTRRTLTNMCMDGRIRAFKLGKRWLIPKTEVDRWFDPSDSEIGRK